MAVQKRRVGDVSYTIPLFLPVSTWKTPRISELPSWGETGRVALDCETKDPLLRDMGIGVRRGGYITGYSFAIDGGPRKYVPLRHEGGDNVEDVDQALAYLRAQIKTWKGDVVGANLQYDLDYLMEEGCDFGQTSRFLDIQVAEPLIDELQDRFGLDALAKKYLGEPKDEGLLKDAANCYGFDPKKEMWRIPARFVGGYAESDVRQPLEIMALQEKVIETENLGRIFKLESELLPVLVKMRRRGVRIDQDHLSRVETWSTREEQKAAAMVRHHTGIDIGMNNVWKAEVMAAPLRKAGHTIPMKMHPTTKKMNPSVTADWLLALQKAGCPVAGAIARARKVNKVRTTFAASVRRHMVKGRVHCTFNQLRKSSDDGSGGSDSEQTEGAAFGRLSCVDPNLQQQPARDPELGPMWRAVYVPDEGKLWCSNDYSQQEPRWAVHYSEMTYTLSSGKLMTVLEGRQYDRAVQAGNKYREDPDTDNHQMMADMAGIKRKDAKEIYLGLTYGMGGAKLSRKLGLPTKWVESKKRGMIEVAGDEGQFLLDKFDYEVPFLKGLARRCEKDAATRGWIMTSGGRKCHFPPKSGDLVGYDWAHKALNRLIQGSSGDQTKQAIVNIDRAGYPIQLQIHDEIASSVDSHEEARAIAGEMLRALPMSLPSKVDTELGTSWGASMGWKGWPE